jgi:hypothetical protein
MSRAECALDGAPRPSNGTCGADDDSSHPPAFGEPVASLPETLGALKRSPYAERQGRSVKDEVRRNLLARLAGGGPLFEGVLGYEETVMPQIVNALLSRHNFILLGLRGQAKSRILRALGTLLDPEMPVVAGSEVNDDPFGPISKYAKTCSPRAATTRRSPGWGATSASSRSSPRPT